MPDSSRRWPGVLVSDFPPRQLRTSGFRTHTLCFGHLRVGVPLFLFPVLVPFFLFFFSRSVSLSLSLVFDASTSPRATRLSQVFCSHSLVSRSLFLWVRPHFLHVTSRVRLLGVDCGGSSWPSGPPSGTRPGHRVSARPSVCPGRLDFSDQTSTGRTHAFFSGSLLLHVVRMVFWR